MEPWKKTSLSNYFLYSARERYCHEHLNGIPTGPWHLSHFFKINYQMQCYSQHCQPFWILSCAHCIVSIMMLKLRVWHLANFSFVIFGEFGRGPIVILVCKSFSKALPAHVAFSFPFLCFWKPYFCTARELLPWILSHPAFLKIIGGIDARKLIIISLHRCNIPRSVWSVGEG